MSRRVSATLIAVIILACLLGFTLLEYYVTTRNLLKDYRVLKESYIALENAHEALKSSYGSLKKSYDSLSANYTHLRLDYQLLKTSYNELAAKHEKLQLKYSELEKNYSILESKYQSITREYESLNEEYQRLQSSYRDLKTAREALGGELSALKQKLSEISNRILIPADAVPSMLKQSSTRIVTEIVYDQLKLSKDMQPGVKAKRIFEWIAVNTRYMSDDFHMAMLDSEMTPYMDFISLPNETLSRGGGDCEDLATLAYTMLKAVLGADEEVYIIEYKGGRFSHWAVLYRVGQRFMIVDPAGSYVSDAALMMEFHMEKDHDAYKVWLPPMSINVKEKNWLLEEGFGRLKYFSTFSWKEAEGYRLLDLQDAVNLWISYWKPYAGAIHVSLIANDTFYREFSSTQELLDWMAT